MLRPIVLLMVAGGLAHAQAARVGVVIGTVTVDSTRPVVNARVSTKGVGEVRTDSAGRFILRGIPAGTRTIEIRAIGLDPASLDVEVIGGDTTRFQVNLDTKVTELDSVKVKATNKVMAQFKNDFIQRRKMGLGHFMDSSTVGKYGFLMQAFDAVPGLKVVRVRGSEFALETRGCTPALWINGVRQRGLGGRGYETDFSFLNELPPDQIAGVEVYPSGLTAPPEYSARGCGSVVVWTKKGWPP